MDLTDAQWAVLQPFLHPKPVRKRGRPWQDARAVFNGILWVLRTGAPWHDLPDRYPPYQTKLAEGTLQPRSPGAWPERMIGDTAYDSAPLDRQLWREHRIRMIAPNRPNRLNLTQDRRELRCYCRRWKIERLFAWLHNFRRLVTRWEFYEANFLGMLQLGCLIILLRNL